MLKVIVSYQIDGKNFQRKMQLSAGNTLGSSYMLVVPKSSKDAVAIQISGRAYYENAEFDLIQQTLNNGEAQFHLEEKHLVNKIR